MEKILLSSRNGETMLLVRYSDLKRGIEQSYAELCRKQVEGTSGHFQSSQMDSHPLTSSTIRTGSGSGSASVSSGVSAVGAMRTSLLRPIKK